MAPKRKANAQSTLDQTGEYEMRCSEGSDAQFSAAHTLIATAQYVSEHVKILTNDLKEMKGLFESLAKIVNDLKDAGLEEEPLSKRAAALSNSIIELRDMHAVMISESGDVTIVEVYILRSSNAELASVNNELQQQLKTLRLLLEETYESRISAAQSVQIDLSAGLSRYTANPFKGIKCALKNLEDVNEGLDQRCTELEKTDADKSPKIADFTTKVTLLEAIRQKAIGFAAISARNNTEHEEIALLKARARISDIVRQNGCLVFEKVQLKLNIVGEASQQVTADAAREETNEDLREACEHDNRFISDIKTVAAEQITCANDRSEALSVELEAFRDSSDLSSTIIGSAKNSEERAQKLVKDAEARKKIAVESKPSHSRCIHRQDLQKLDAKVTAQTDKDMMTRLTAKAKAKANVIGGLKERCDTLLEENNA